MTPEELAATLVQCKAEAGRLHLWRTLHAIDGATTVIGWEIAEQRSRGASETQSHLEEADT